MTNLPSSFRDPDGFVFKHEDIYYRAINKSYQEHYNLLLGSNLYLQLVEKKYLIPHTEIAVNDSFSLLQNENLYKIILPQQIPFITYPNEWSFGMYKDAALLTIEIAILALQNGMVLKDATAFNVQFLNGQPIFIDTLSFEKYIENTTWVAYKQFCENFLLPLLLIKYCNLNLNNLIVLYPQGIPLQLATSLLPTKTKYHLNNYLHIYLHNKIVQKNGVKKNSAPVNFSKTKLLNLFRGLKNYVQSIILKPTVSTWNNYYTHTIISEQYLHNKINIITHLLKDKQYNTAADIGCNDGTFSYLLSPHAKNVIAIDADAHCVNTLYKTCKIKNYTNILPVVNDLNNPTPAFGWSNAERDSLTQRLQADLMVALAIVHHFVVANNIPLQNLAKWFAQRCTYLLIEFVPKEDEKVQLLLQNRKDIFENYTQQNFTQVFEQYFEIQNQIIIEPTCRVLFYFKKHVGR